jgi:hypothetical protein
LSIRKFQVSLNASMVAAPASRVAAADAASGADSAPKR